MYYFLNYEYGLRKFNDAGYCVLRRYDKTFYMPITEKEFDILKEAWETSISDDDRNKRSVIEKFSLYDILLPLVDNFNMMDPWQCKVCDNDLHMEMEVAITQRCNYNCKYCFEAADTNKMTDEFTLEEMNALLDDAVRCGINCIALTGGEPMIHKDFMSIISLISNKGLGISEILTNGSMITDEFLDKLSTYDCCRYTIFRISFDGVHDKHNNIRQTNSEDTVFKNIKRCIEHGFKVKVTYNLNHQNEDELKDTALLMYNVGVSEFRIVRTMPSRKLRALEMDNIIFNHEEWLNAALDFANWYMYLTNSCSFNVFEETSMAIDFWNVFYLNPRKHMITLNAIKGCGHKNIDDDLILCPLTKARICVCGDGSMVPCHQISGGLKKQRIDLGNVKRDGLYSILKDSKWKDLINTKVTERLKHQEKCKNCEYWDMCLGGCPVIGAPWRWEHGEKFPFSTDVTQCAFFEGDYISKFKKLTEDYEWHLPIFFGLPLPINEEQPGNTRMELRK